MLFTLLLSKIFLIPRYPAFGKLEVKMVAGTTSLVGKLPLLSAFLWSLISSLGDNLTVKSDLMYLFYWLFLSKVVHLPKVCFSFRILLEIQHKKYRGVNQSTAT